MRLSLSEVFVILPKDHFFVDGTKPEEQHRNKYLHNVLMHTSAIILSHCKAIHLRVKKQSGNDKNATKTDCSDYHYQVVIIV